MDKTETDKNILPKWLYPGAFVVVVALLALGLFIPAVQQVGVLALLLTPVVAALVVVVTHWRRDRPLAIAALLALLGLALVFFARGLVHR